ncbi:anthranilate phosphoribosyltransferase [Carbonactinospora thermoautotrophica]|uniref:anthranilate phosphoribosyltransferase n=1 Tax=Carbonactinospora thermoautotrophica TaxID=1469144 RepID=UPI0022702AA1|nr:anthranilate phosphoribosyltransferase [Carbonactinospora thermoautotrophica]MCX9190848.1 anthranilate phosphoribosyltransferase [Carbonactinospora thermoautotrophica]
MSSRSDTPARTWSNLLAALLKGEDLAREDTAWAMDQIMRGEATPVQIAGFVVALRAKGETVEEIEGFVETMYEHATTISVPGRLVDIVGTGGDRAHTVNISTMASIVTAGTGATVVKHGNRAASSSSGAADVLEALGVRLNLAPQDVALVAEKAGITFCFAPVFHPAMRHTAVPRRELGVPTMFNFLGPLTNPARVRAQAVGVADARMAPLMAGVLARRGNSALVFRGDDGLDELTPTATSTVWVVRNGEVHQASVDPLDLGIERVAKEALRGRDAAYNARVARSVLAGERGPVRDAVLLNSAAALVALDLTDAPLVDQLRAALARAAESIDSGAAARTLDTWVRVTQELAS